MLTTLLTATTFLLVLALAWVFIRQRAAIDAGNIPWRIAMDFIAEEGCEMPHEFAACFLSGNRRAIDEKFPNFEGFARQRRAEWGAE
jgi:hypothetical protein